MLTSASVRKLLTILAITVVSALYFALAQLAPEVNFPPCGIIQAAVLSKGQLCGPATANLVNIQVSPGSQIALVGDTPAYTATGGYDDGTFADITASALWLSSNNAIASPIPPNPGSNPMLYVCGSAGQVNLTATLSGINGGASLTCNAIPPCNITSTSLPDGIVGTAYSAQVQSINCVAPVVWSLSAGTLPTGLTLSSTTGLVSGTPTTVGTFTFTVRAQDTNSSADTQQFTVGISAAPTGDPAPPALTVSPDECNGTPTQQLFVDDGTGTGHYPYTFTGWRAAIAQAESDRKNTGVGTYINMRPFWNGTAKAVLHMNNSNDLVLYTQIAGDTSTNCIITRSANFASFPSGRLEPYVTHYISVFNTGGKWIIDFQGGIPSDVTIPAAAPGYVQLIHMADPSINGTYLIESYNSSLGRITTSANTATGAGRSSFGFAKVSKAPGQGGLYDMWRLESPATVSPMLDLDNATHHLQFEEAEMVMMITTGYSADIMQMGPQQATNPSDNGQHIHITRSYFHGYDHFNDGTSGDIETNVSNAMRMNCAYCSINRTKIDQIHKTGNETHAILSKNSAGPLLIWNNDIEAATCGIFVGGNPPFLDGGRTFTSDVEISGNIISRNVDWYTISNGHYTGNKWGLKNLVEFKFCRRCAVYGNRIRINWADGQAGFWLLLTPKADGDTGHYTAVEDILISNNVVSDSDQGIQQSGRSGPNAQDGDGVSPAGRRWKIRNNLMWGLGIHQVTGSNMLQQGTNGEDYAATATRDSCPGGVCTVTYSLTATPNSLHHGLLTGDFVRVTACLDTTFNVDRLPAAAPTDFNVQPLTVYVHQVGGFTPSASTTGCNLNNGEGIAESFKVEHNTFIVDSVAKLMSDAHSKTYMRNTVMKNNLWATAFPTIGMLCTGNNEGWFTGDTGSESCFDTASLQFHHMALGGVVISRYAEFPGAVKPPVTLWAPVPKCTSTYDVSCVGFTGNYSFSSPEVGGLISIWNGNGQQTNIQMIGTSSFLYSDSRVTETYDSSCISGCPQSGTYLTHQGIGITQFQRTAGVSTLTLMFPAITLGSVTSPLFVNVPPDSTFAKCTGGCAISAIGTNTVSYTNCAVGPGCPDVGLTTVHDAAATVITALVANYYVRDVVTGETTASLVNGGGVKLGTITASPSAQPYKDWQLCSGAGLPDSRCPAASYFAAGHPGQSDDGKDLGVDFTELNLAIANGQYGQRLPH